MIASIQVISKRLENTSGGQKDQDEPKKPRRAKKNQKGPQRSIGAQKTNRSPTE
jgi:hypothetical protein